jgi:hypothetical protein
MPGEDSRLIGLWEAWKGALLDELAQESEEEAEKAHLKLVEIEKQISDTPAEGLHGIAVQLGLWHVQGGTAKSEPRDALAIAVCDAVVRHTGRDCLAEANAIFERVIDTDELQ